MSLLSRVGAGVRLLRRPTTNDARSDGSGSSKGVARGVCASTERRSRPRRRDDQVATHPRDRRRVRSQLLRSLARRRRPPRRFPSRTRPRARHGTRGPASARGARSHSVRLLARVERASPPPARWRPRSNSRRCAPTPLEIITFFSSDDAHPSARSPSPSSSPLLPPPAPRRRFVTSRIRCTRSVRWRPWRWSRWRERARARTTPPSSTRSWSASRSISRRAPIQTNARADSSASPPSPWASARTTSPPSLPWSPHPRRVHRPGRPRSLLRV